MARLYQINISKGGVPKHRVEDATVDYLGILGDYHNDREHHGGPDKALCMFSLEVIEQLRSEGHNIAPGHLGENLTISGLNWEQIIPGTKLLIGDTLLVEVTGYTNPCYKIGAFFKDGKFSRVSQKTHPGNSRVYARVIVPGRIKQGDQVTIVP